MSILATAQGAYRAMTGMAGKLEPLALLALRLAVARVFFMSGLSKWNGPLSFNPDKYDLFLYEFFCPEVPRPGALVLCSDPAKGTYAPAMQWAVERFANLAGVMEIVLPVLLVLGLLSRFAALGLLAMTLFISVLVFPDWDSWWGSHVWWTASLLGILALGPGGWSLDRLFKLDGSYKR